MMVQDTLVPAGPAIPASDTPATLISCESQSCDELKAIASRGAHGGDLYFAAVKELERRAHDMEVALEDEQVTAIARRRGLVLSVGTLFAAVLVAAVALMLGY